MIPSSKKGSNCLGRRFISCLRRWEVSGKWTGGGGREAVEMEGIVRTDQIIRLIQFHGLACTCNEVFVWCATRMPS